MLLVFSFIAGYRTYLLDTALERDLLVYLQSKPTVSIFLDVETKRALSITLAQSTDQIRDWLVEEDIAFNSHFIKGLLFCIVLTEKTVEKTKKTREKV